MLKTNALLFKSYKVNISNPPYIKDPYQVFLF